MSRLTRILVLTAAAAFSAMALTAGPALARGGDPAPTETTPYVNYCANEPWVTQLADGSTVFANEANGAGCVYVRNYPAGYLRLDHVVLAPGWTYVVKSNGDGTSSRVQLQFTETATGRRVDFRVEYGKTKIG